MMKRWCARPGFILIPVVVSFITLFLLGCDFDDDNNDKGEITICNNDNQAYDIELRRDSDDSLEDEIHVDAWHDLFDRCETFYSIDKGRYYLVILDDDNNIEDESDDFYIKEGESKSFTIDNTGDIINSLLYHDEAIVSVCNLDDDNYRVELKRSSDDSLVSDINLEQCNDFYVLTEDHYYIEIFTESDNNKAARSENFYLEPQQVVSFTINQHGDLMDAQ